LLVIVQKLIEEAALLEGSAACKIFIEQIWAGRPGVRDTCRNWGRRDGTAEAVCIVGRERVVAISVYDVPDDHPAVRVRRAVLVVLPCDDISSSTRPMVVLIRMVL
jgi:hypothetical protein